MASATFTLFDEFGNELGKAGHNLSTAVIKAYLTSSTPVKATNTTRADHTVLSGNGSDEKTVTATWAETGAGTGVWRLTIGADQTWTGSGAGFTARAVVLDNTTANKLIGFWDYGSSQAVGLNETFQLDVDANFAAFTLTV